jgi:hypothetical protein
MTVDDMSIPDKLQNPFLLGSIAEWLRSTQKKRRRKGREKDQKFESLLPIL